MLLLTLLLSAWLLLLPLLTLFIPPGSKPPGVPMQGLEKPIIISAHKIIYTAYIMEKK